MMEFAGKLNNEKASGTNENFEIPECNEILFLSFINFSDAKSVVKKDCQNGLSLEFNFENVKISLEKLENRVTLNGTKNFNF